MAVDAVRRLVIVSSDPTLVGDMKLYVYSLDDGSLIRSFGGRGSGPGQFRWLCGGLCMTPRGTLLVSDYFNKRVQEIDVDDGSHVRDLGVGLYSEHVDCSDRIVVSCEGNSAVVNLLSWMDGSVLLRFGGEGHCDGQLRQPGGPSLLSDGSSIVVGEATHYSSRLCQFSSSSEYACSGAFVRTVLPEVELALVDVVECNSGRNLIVAAHNHSGIASRRDAGLLWVATAESASSVGVGRGSTGGAAAAPGRGRPKGTTTAASSAVLTNAATRWTDRGHRESQGTARLGTMAALRQPRSP